MHLGSLVGIGTFLKKRKTHQGASQHFPAFIKEVTLTLMGVFWSELEHEGRTKNECVTPPVASKEKSRRTLMGSFGWNGNMAQSHSFYEKGLSGMVTGGSNLRWFAIRPPSKDLASLS